MSKLLFIYFQIQVEYNSISYICISFLHNISENKPPLYPVLNKISRIKIIPSIQKLTQLGKHSTTPCFNFVQMYKLQGYGQYKMHGSGKSFLAWYH